MYVQCSWVVQAFYAAWNRRGAAGVYRGHWGFYGSCNVLPIPGSRQLQYYIPSGYYWCLRVLLDPPSREASGPGWTAPCSLRESHSSKMNVVHPFTGAFATMKLSSQFNAEHKPNIDGIRTSRRFPQPWGPSYFYSVLEQHVREESHLLVPHLKGPCPVHPHNARRRSKAPHT